MDNFAGNLYLSNPLVNPGTANTFLGSSSFGTTGTAPKWRASSLP